MSELKMSDVFTLPMCFDGEYVRSGDYWNVIKFDRSDSNVKQQAECVVLAINSYDSHTEQIAKLTKGVELLRKALKLVKVNLSYSQDAFAGEYIQMAKKALSETELSN